MPKKTGLQMRRSLGLLFRLGPFTASITPNGARLGVDLLRMKFGDKDKKTKDTDEGTDKPRPRKRKKQKEAVA